MTGRWANHEDVGSGGVFEALHSGLTVGLIATPRDALMTCRVDELLLKVIERNKETYDFLPVTVPIGSGGERIVGLVHAAKLVGGFASESRVNEHYAPLSEEDLIGADASILDLIKDADEKPCRLVVSGATIVGLVSLSDLQKLPVRAALFALITGFEITMSDAIRRASPNKEQWLGCLNPGRRKKIKEQIGESRKDDGFVDALLFTQFCDKVEIVLKTLQLSGSKRKLRDQLAAIQSLRDNVAHANEYAAAPAQARKVCAIIRNLLALREEITAGRRCAT